MNPLPSSDSSQEIYSQIANCDHAWLSVHPFRSNREDATITAYCKKCGVWLRHPDLPPGKPLQAEQLSQGQPA